MFKPFSLTPIAISIALASSSLAQATTAQSNTASWYQEPALKAKAAKQVKINWRKWQTKQKIKVQNTSNFNANSPQRLVLKTWRHVLNADGYTEQGYPYIDICRVDCNLAAKAKTKINVIYQSYFWDFFFFNKPQVKVETQPYQLQLLHNADMDGSSGALQNVTAFSALVNAFRDQHPDNTLLLSSGDNYIPGPRFAAAADASLNPWLGVAGQGRGDIAFMNAMGYQASAVGNHDLDSGTQGFANIIAQEANEQGYYPGALFPYLSANLDFSSDAFLSPLISADNQAPEDMINSVAKSTVIHVNGEKVGVLGATTPKLKQITSTGDITIKPEDGDDIKALASQIQSAVNALKQQGINKIILLSHMQQISLEKQLAGLLEGVDIIVAGGSNTLLADDNDQLRDGDTAADTYPLIINSAKNEPVLVVNTDGDYKYLGRLVSEFDLQGRVITERLDSQVNGAYAAQEATLEQLGNPVANADVADIAAQLTQVLAERDGNIAGKTQVYLDGRRASVRTQETNMGNLSADANLWQAQAVDPSVQLSLKNGGGIRDDIGYFSFPPGSTNPEDLAYFPPAANPAAGKADGDISQFDIQNSLRFNNGLSLLSLTAQNLQAVFEHSVAASEAGATPGRFPQVAGVRFSFDPTQAAGARIQSLAIVDNNGDIVDVLVANGELQGDSQRIIRIVTLGFLAGGGDGFPFPQDESAKRLDLEDAGLAAGEVDFAAAGSEQDALAEYLKANYSQQAYDQVETPMSEDTRIQNLSVREDTVLNH